MKTAFKFIGIALAALLAGAMFAVVFPTANAWLLETFPPVIWITL